MKILHGACCDRAIIDLRPGTREDLSTVLSVMHAFSLGRDDVRGLEGYRRGGDQEGEGGWQGARAVRELGRGTGVFDEGQDAEGLESLPDMKEDATSGVNAYEAP